MSVSAVSALIGAMTSVVAALAVDRYHPLGTSQAAEHIFGRLPSSLPDTAIPFALALVAVLVLAIAVSVALLLSRRVLSPVRDLAEAAGRVAGGDLQVRVTPEGGDELAALGRSFDAMTAELGTAVADLRRHEANARRFASDVAHELRSPLASMTAVTDLLAAQAPSMSPDAQRATELVIDGVSRLDRLVQDLTEISRFDAGTVSLDLEVVSLSDAIAACLSLRGWTATVISDVSPQLTAIVDRRRLDVILANLIGNALRHGQPPVQVHVRQRPADLVITVTDHGPGIPPDVLPLLFERLYKTGPSRSRSDGSGLGLAIALENARLHGGSITAGNAVHGGAVFSLALPTFGPVPPD